MPETITVGLELEAVELAPSYESILQECGFRFHRDASIRETDGRNPANAGEIVTGVLSSSVTLDSGIIVDTSALETPLRRLCECAARVNSTCGIHVHVGKPNRNGKSKWSKDEVGTWLCIGSLLEEKLFELCPASRRQSSHCKSISAAFSEQELTSLDQIGEVVDRKYSNQKRYCWLNLTETKRRGNANLPDGRAESESPGTVEIRMLGNTKRYDYVLAWTRLCVAMAGSIAYLPSPVAFMRAKHGKLDSFFQDVKTAKESITRNATAQRVEERSATRQRRRNSGDYSDVPVEIPLVRAE